MAILPSDIPSYTTPLAISNSQFTGRYAVTYFNAIFEAMRKSLASTTSMITFAGFAGTGIAAPGIGMPSLNEQLFVATALPIITAAGFRPNFGRFASWAPTTRYLQAYAAFITTMKTKASVILLPPSPVVGLPVPGNPMGNGVGTLIYAALSVPEEIVYTLMIDELRRAGFGYRGVFNNESQRWHRALAKSYTTYLPISTPGTTLAVTGISGPFPTAFTNTGYYVS